MNNIKIQEIRQNGQTILYSTDGITIGIIFNNLIGKNSKNTTDYYNYIQYVAIPQMGFTYGDIELIENGITVKTGQIKIKL